MKNQLLTGAVALVSVLSLAACDSSSGAAGTPDLEKDVADGRALVRATAPVLSQGEGVTWLGLNGDVTRCGGNFAVASFSAAGDMPQGAPSAAAAKQALGAAGMATTTDDGDLLVRRGRATMTYRVLPVRGGESVIGSYSVKTPCTEASGKTIRSLEKRDRTDFARELDLPR